MPQPSLDRGDDVVSHGPPEARTTAKPLLVVLAIAGLTLTAVVRPQALGLPADSNDSKQDEQSQKGQNTPGPAGEGPSPSAASSQNVAAAVAPLPRPDAPSDRDTLRWVLHDTNPYITIADSEAQSAVARRCHGDLNCNTAVLVTSDGWATAHWQVLYGAQWAWSAVTPSGAVGWMQDSVRTGGILRPDGTTEPLEVTTVPTEATPHAVITGPPPASELADESMFSIWVLDDVADTLRPLVSAPSGRLLADPQPNAHGGVVVALAHPPSNHVTIARRDDAGHWTTTEISPDSPRATLPAYFAVGPHGEMALLFSSDGATLAPYVELWTSDGATGDWRLVRSARHPRNALGLGYTSAGSLVVGEEYPKPRLWILGAAGNLRPVRGSVPVSALTSQHGIVSAATSDGLLTSIDARHWIPIDLMTAAGL